MQYSAKEIIKRRRSVRTFDGRPLGAKDRQALEAYLSTLTNPFGVPVEFRLLDAGENGLTSPVIVGASLYLAAKVKRVQNYEIAFGYSFEAACLHALSLGIGTVMLAASLNRAAFERAMDIGADEVMPVASPVGYPAEKKSLRETLMRKGTGADERLPFEKLYFEGSFGTSLPKDRAGVFADALEAARWAPSAVNRQPWRAVADGNAVHFYEAKTMKDSPIVDIQRVDIGIALSHFDLALSEDGISGSFTSADPKLPVPENAQYVITFERNN